jgi:hypothetical protein
MCASAVDREYLLSLTSRFLSACPLLRLLDVGLSLSPREKALSITEEVFEVGMLGALSMVLVLE